MAVPSEFEFEIDNARARWLRRRFLWFCTISLLLSLWTDWAALARLRADEPAATRRAAIVSVTGCSVEACLYMAAMVFVWYTSADRRRIVRLALAIIVVTGAIAIGSQRVSGSLNPAGWPALGVETFKLALNIGGLTHLLPALFLPWTLRESLQPVAPLMAYAAGVLIFDRLSGHVGNRDLWLLIRLPLPFIPGTLISWWRYSRFRRSFQLRFESSRYRLLQGELVSARRLHESCLPPQIDDGPVCLRYVYEPMRQIGGDLIFVHPRQRSDGLPMSVLLLDVTGHGIPAAMTVNRLVGELERLFAETPDARPGDILTGLNRYFGLTLVRHGIFATAVCARIDPDRGVMEWCNAGHPTAYLRRQGGTLEPLASTTFMLGAAEHHEFCADPMTVPFEPGDALVCYTDGAAEAQNRLGQRIGIDGVRRLLGRCASDSCGPACWADDLLSAVRAHRAAPPEDDTLVAVIYRPPSPPRSSPPAASGRG